VNDFARIVGAGVLDDRLHPAQEINV